MSLGEPSWFYSAGSLPSSPIGCISDKIISIITIQRTPLYVCTRIVTTSDTRYKIVTTSIFLKKLRTFQRGKQFIEIQRARQECRPAESGRRYHVRSTPGKKFTLMIVYLGALPWRWDWGGSGEVLRHGKAISLSAMEIYLLSVDYRLFKLYNR